MYNFYCQTAYEEAEEAKEASRDLINNLTRELILDTPRRSQELCQKRKVKTRGISL